jgi:hypothetical protein
MRFALLPIAFAAVAAAQTQPVAVMVVPADGAVNVPLNARILAALSYPATYSTSGAIRLTKAAAAVNGASVLPAMSTLQPPQNAFGWFAFAPDRPLDPNTKYNVEVYAPGRPSSFTTFTTGAAPDTTPLQLVSSDPAPGQSSVNTAGRATLRFNKPLDPFSFPQTGIVIRDLTTGYAQGYDGPRVEPDGVTVTLAFATPSMRGLQLGHSYRMEIADGIKDWLGNPLSTAPAVPFTTLRAAESAGPRLTGSAPADGEAGVPLNSNMVLVFDKPLAPVPLESGISLDANGPAKFKVDTLAGGRGLVIQPALLYPPNTQVTIRVAGLLDADGGMLAAPFTVGFRTGSAPDTRALQMRQPGSAVYPRNGVIQTTFNRPVDPILLALGGVTLGAFNSNTPVDYTLSDDGRVLRIGGAGPLPPGAYTAQVSIPFDRLNGKLQPFSTTFTVTGDDDVTAPRIRAVSPPDGASTVPLSAMIQAAFDEPVDGNAAVFELLRDGNPVAGTAAFSGSTANFVPKAALTGSTSYQIAISGAADLAGNVLPPFTSSFTTAAANPAAEKFQVVAADPAANATGVDPSAVVRVTFNRAVNPVSVYQPANQFSLNTSGLAGVAGAYSVDGATITFTPASPLRAGRYYFSPRGVADLAGVAMSPYNATFDVSGSVVDTTPPSVISVSPGDGETVYYAAPYVVFTFSKPLDRSTVNSATFVGIGDKGVIPLTLSPSEDPRKVVVSFKADPGALVTLYINPGVTDQAGNPLAPFRATVRMSEAPGAAQLPITLRPGYRLSSLEQMNLPPDIGITVLFAAPVDRASVEQGLLVSADGELVGGSVQWTPDSTALTFLAAKPYPYGASVAVVIRRPARYAAGGDIAYEAGYYSALTIAAAPAPAPPAISVARTNVPQPPARLPLDPVIDLVFSQDVPASFVRPATLTDASTAAHGPDVVCDAAQLGPRVIRFRPQTLLRADMTYTFAFDSGAGFKYSNFIFTGSSAAAPSPRLAGYGPTGQAVPLNAIVTVAFSSQVSELSMPGAVTLRRGDAVVPSRFYWGAADHGLVIWPSALLAPDTEYTVTVDGFEDLAGHAIAGARWNFHTSAVTDLQPPSVLRVEPGGAEASPNATIAATFSEPVAVDWIGGLTVVDSALGAIAGDARFSDDQRILYFTPARPLRPGATVTVGIPYNLEDAAANLSANSPGAVSASFRVGYATPGAPVVVAATPDDGSANAPLNARIQVRFDQPISTAVLDGVQLVVDGSPAAATIRLEADGRTLTIVPARLPVAGAVCAVTVAGVRNSSGDAMASPYQWSFTMGSAVDTSGPVLRFSPANGQSEVPVNAAIRLRSNEPLNRLTVTPRNVILRWQPFGPVAADVQLQDGGRTIVVTPAAPLPRDAAFVLSIAGVADLAGNLATSGFGPSVDVSFSTASGIATAPVRLLALDPPDGSTVAAGWPIQALFSNFVDLPNGDDSFQLSGPSGAVRGAVSGNGRTLVFTPARPLADGPYQLAITGVLDVAGAAVAPALSSFTVDSAPKPATTGFTMTGATPANGAAGVPPDTVVTMTFSRPVSSVSAAQLRATTETGDLVPGAIETRGGTVTFTPSAPMPGAARITISGGVRDLNGASTNTYLQFTTGSSPDTTPPVLEFAYPAEGAIVRAFGVNAVLRFSEPVLVSASGLRVLAGSSDVAGFNAGEDGRTFSGSWSLPPDSDITIVASGVRDFAGNALAPVSIHFRTASDALSRSPKVVSVSPAGGAINVPPTQAVEVRFSHPMETASVRSSLHVSERSALLTGVSTVDADAQVLRFQPDTTYAAGDAVAIDLESSAYSAAGVRIEGEWHSTFHTASQAGSANAVAFSASARSIDVRFDGPAPERACRGYLHTAGRRIEVACAAESADQIRITPVEPLSTGTPYRLVLDAAHEIAFEVEGGAQEEDAAASIEMDATGEVTLGFRSAVNPLTVLRGVRLETSAGERVFYTMYTSADGRSVRLVPGRLREELKVIVDWVESRRGTRIHIASKLRG